MTISELIEKLEEVKKEHGDIEVEYSYNDGGYFLGGSSDITYYEIETSYFNGNEYKTLVLC